MKQINDQFTPIKLPEVHLVRRITTRGYYIVEIKRTWKSPQRVRHLLCFEFEVIEGKFKGALITRCFPKSEGGLESLSCMCSAVGITGELKHPKLLIGKRLTVLIIQKEISI